MSDETDSRHPSRPAQGQAPTCHSSDSIKNIKNIKNSKTNKTSKSQEPGPRSHRTRASRDAEASSGRRDDRKRLGDEGERRAATFLRRRGYRILARNVRCAGVELDLVARRGRLIVFIEVKTRRTARFGAPELAVDAAKQARIVRGASGWLRENPGVAQHVRFDVVSCRVGADGGHDTWGITHLVDAFRAGD